MTSSLVRWWTRLLIIVNSTFHDSKTIMSDNDIKFAGYEEVAKITDANFYFAKPHRLTDWELNEQINGLVRRFLSKGIDFN
ncbi:hypothetical protein [Candidatus Enterovibrio escicola]|uniref:hypothetical protein n=1 Tax=Candidatus Enterovibrio escicola TaxID=1927127 RepID=UPI00168130DA|nr:hypothetical protein [Candidatus Enterovibrio escacola]